MHENTTRATYRYLQILFLGKKKHTINSDFDVTEINVFFFVLLFVLYIYSYHTSQLPATTKQCSFNSLVMN